MKKKSKLVLGALIVLITLISYHFFIENIISISTTVAPLTGTPIINATNKNAPGADIADQKLSKDWGFSGLSPFGSCTEAQPCALEGEGDVDVIEQPLSLAEKLQHLLLNLQQGKLSAAFDAHKVMTQCNLSNTAHKISTELMRFSFPNREKCGADDLHSFTAEFDKEFYDQIDKLSFEADKLKYRIQYLRSKAMFQDILDNKDMYIVTRTENGGTSVSLKADAPPKRKSALWNEVSMLMNDNPGFVDSESLRDDLLLDIL